MKIKVEKTELAKELDISWDLYQHYENDAGYDVRACILNPIKLLPKHRVLIPTGLHIEMLSSNYEIQVRPRSGLAAKYGITVLNTPGTIDFGYRDEIKVILINHSNDIFTIFQGDRIAQICFREIPNITIENVEKIDKTVNRQGGFGSSGI